MIPCCPVQLCTPGATELALQERKSIPFSGSVFKKDSLGSNEDYIGSWQMGWKNGLMKVDFGLLAQCYVGERMH